MPAVRTRSILVAITATVLCLSACSSHGGIRSSAVTPSGGTETNPAGDIPDNQAFVPFKASSGLFQISVPEGWAQSSSGKSVTFSDKYNQVRIETTPSAAAPTVDSANVNELPVIEKTVQQFVRGETTAVQRKAGTAILITYADLSAPNAVTGKTVTESVERYEFFHASQEVILTLSSPTGSDNVDPWRTTTDSLQWLG